MSSTKKYVYYGLAVVLAIVASSFVGVKIGEAVNRQRLERFRSTSASSSSEILSAMQNVEKGEKITDHVFEDLERNLVQISKLLNGNKTAIIFINPDCFTCLQEIEVIKMFAKTPEQMSKFVLISSGNPLHLIDLRKEYDIKFTMLYDHMGMFHKMFKVQTYPFNLIVDDQLQIIEAVPRPFTESEIKSIID